MSAKRRRSKRVDKSERVMLNLATPTAVQDIVVTIEVSAHGAKVLARRRMAPEARGVALYIAAGRQVPCRIAWQRAPGPDGRMETGLEIYSNTNFWGFDLTGSEVVEDVPVVDQPPLTAAILLEALDLKMDPSRLSIQLCCALVDSLETRGVFTRDELIATLRHMSQQ